MAEKQRLSVGRFRFVPHGKRHDETAPPEPTPYGLEVVHSCLSCPYREDRLFCNLPPAALQRLAEIGFLSSYPNGAVLFVEGQEPRGVFILCVGRVKLSTASVDGRTLIVRFAEPGELLGLPSTVTGKTYSLTAEVIRPTQVKFVPRQDFLDFLREYGDVALRVAQQLGETYHVAVEEMRTIGLSHSAEEKVVHFLLDWSAKYKLEGAPLSFKQMLTHEEIAEIVGLTRETVTRVLSKFRKANLVTVKGSTVTIKDKAALERFLDEGSRTAHLKSQ
jgi:CRP/FNR family transcriptional regulator, cyclic AMP receptor protein